MSDTEKNYPGSERKELGKKKDGKKDKKEKGYVMFDADASDEDLGMGEDTKSPSKMKKGKAFRFGSRKDILPKLKDKEEKKEKDAKKEGKDRRKEEKKPKIKGKKKSKHDIAAHAVPEVIEQPVFGVPLTVAIERNRSHDGVQLPALFRECIDYIEEHGLHCEGIYRISGVKSKVQHLKDLYNRGQEVFLEEHEPNIVAGVLKQFLRELPEPVLTNALIPKFEEASTIRNERRRVESFLKLINDLPQCNKLLLSWMIVHMTHVIERQKENKMTLQNVSIVLSPTMQISHRVLNVLFSHTRQLFWDINIKRYVPPLKPATSRWSLELPDNPAALQEELNKQESLLNQLHEELAAGKADSEKEEQIWEVQRVCTQLKRKIKLAQKNVDAIEKRKRERDESSKRNTVQEEGDEELRLELQQPPEIEELNLELQQPPDDGIGAEQVADEHGEFTTTGEPQSQKEATQTEIEASKNEKEASKNESEALESQNEAKVSETKTDVGDSKKETVDGKVTLKELASQSSANKTTEPKEETESSDQQSTIEQENKTKLSETEDEVDEAKQDKELEEDQTKTEADADSKVTVTVKTRSDSEPTSVETQKEEENEDGTVFKTVISVEGEKRVEGDGREKGSSESLGTSTEDIGDLTAEQVKADMLKKQALMLQEDTTDSELGQSRESIQKVGSESDEFEHSLDEILERDLNIDTDSCGPDDELKEIVEDAKTPRETAASEEEVVDESTEGQQTEEKEESVAMETKTPVPVETPDSPPTITPVPEIVEETAEIELNTSSEAQTGAESGMELEISEMSEMSEDEDVTEEEFEALLEKEYALRLEHEELLAIESELRKKIETERCESDTLQQEIDELQYLRQDSDEEILSTSSDSSYESEDEEDLQEILQHLIQQNEQLEKKNSELCTNIHRERMICLNVKVEIELLKHQRAKNKRNQDSQYDKDMIEFD